jgi:hypothetical protein
LKKNPVIQNVAINQHKLLEFFLIIIFLAFGLNLIANQIANNIQIPSNLIITIGVLSIFVPIAYIVYETIKKRNEIREYNSFFIYNKKENRIEPVFNHNFSEDMNDYLNASCVENLNLRSFWKLKPLGNIYDYDGNKTKNFEPSIKFITELAECIILYRFSTHLEDYFDNLKLDSTNLKIFERNQLPEILMNNRFLETISHPMQERPSFSDVDFSEDNDSSIVYCYGSKGEIFNQFKLILPENSIIKKPKENEIIIETDKFNLLIRIDFQGVSINMPFEFHKYYLNFKGSFKDKTDFFIKIEIQIEIKLISFFSRSGWNYYQWIDSFLEDLDQYLSQDVFFERINWKTAYTILRSKKNI